MGRFFLVGGGPAIRTLGDPLIGRFLFEAGGTDAIITIITAGSDEAALANADYWEAFTHMGVTNLYSPQIHSRADAEDWPMANRIADSTAVYIAGGAQSKLMERIGGTPVFKAIVHVLEKGGLIGGTSCGASIMGNPMILDGGFADKHIRRDMIEVCEGFNILGSETSVDTHCSSRGRFPRIMALLHSYPSVQVVGLDENTVIIVRDGIAEIAGYNTAYIFDGREIHPAHPHQSGGFPHICAAGLKLYALMEGDRWNLFDRRPV